MENFNTNVSTPKSRKFKTPREELIAIHKRIYKKNQKKILKTTLVESKEFKRYENEYLRACKDYREIVKVEDLYSQILTCDIIYLGDYHTLNQSQRTLIRILRDIIPKNNKIVLAMEIVMSKYQEILDEYMDSRISDELFVEKINYIKNWIFDTWDNFKPIFDFAKENKIGLFGIDYQPKGSSKLKKRDKFFAKQLVKIIKGVPDHKIIAFVGDLHIAPCHLPFETNKILKENNIAKKSLVIFQNSGSIYWKLVEKNLEQAVDVVRISNDSFCMMNTPPLICQQSYLNWVEHEEGTIEINAPQKNFKALARRIAEFLDINMEEHIDDFSVYTAGDLSFLAVLREDKTFTKRELRDIRNQILASESYYIPQRKIVYLANLSLNHAGEEASHFIKHICSGIEKPRDLIDSFYARILHEAIGFFGSKIVNHKRKAPNPEYYEKEIKRLRRKKRVEEEEHRLKLAKYILIHKRFENGEFNKKLGEMYREEKDMFLSLTHALGYMLGDALYFAMLSNNITKEKIKRLYFDPFEKEGEPYRLYFELIKST